MKSVKYLKYSGLVLAGILISFLCVVLTCAGSSVWGPVVPIFLGAAVLGIFHILLRKIVRKSTGGSALWYGLAAQLLPIIGTAVLLIADLCSINNDVKGIGAVLLWISVIVLTLGAAVSLIMDRVTAKPT